MSFEKKKRLALVSQLILFFFLFSNLNTWHREEPSLPRLQHIPNSSLKKVVSKGVSYKTLARSCRVGPHLEICSTEKNLLEHKDKIPEEVKVDVQKAIDDVKAVQESEDAEDIKAKVQALQVRNGRGGSLGGRVFFFPFFFFVARFFFSSETLQFLVLSCDSHVDTLNYTALEANVRTAGV